MGVNPNIYLSDERYKAALIRLQNQIMSGSKLVAEDSDTIGNKYTHCSWGLCSMSEEQWPDKEDRLHSGAKYRSKGQDCPFDTNRSQRLLTPDGCFRDCKIFQDGLTDRNEAIQLYEIQLEKINGK